MNTILIAHEALSLALFYSCFCRAVHMSTATRVPILLAFWLLGAASVLAVFAPVVIPGWQPDYVTLALILAILVVQYTTAYYWRNCYPPTQFLKP